jgi:hypothetical protein
MRASRRAAAAAIAALALAPAVRAAPFDGSQPIICAPVQILECERAQSCESETAESVDLPQFIRISVQDKTVTGTRPSGTAVNAKIDQVQNIDQHMYLQGVQKRFGWSAVIDHEKGAMTMTIHDQAIGYVIFGACTPR